MTQCLDSSAQSALPRTRGLTDPSWRIKSASPRGITYQPEHTYRRYEPALLWAIFDRLLMKHSDGTLPPIEFFCKGELLRMSGPDGGFTLSVHRVSEDGGCFWEVIPATRPAAAKAPWLEYRYEWVVVK